jgi:trans-aconitate methyltransferase
MGSFGGETAAYYARYRRGYPAVVVDAVVKRLGLGTADVVVDLGCGTGLLTRPLAERVAFVVGVDPEPDMLAIARRDLDPGLRSKVVWLLGSDEELPAVAELHGAGLSAVTIGQALHLMDHERVFRTARTLLRPGGGIAVIANGTPLWQQDSEWSRALRAALEDWFGTTLTAGCGTDLETQARYASALEAAGYEVGEISHSYDARLTAGELLGGVLSALSPGDVPDDRRDAFAEHLLGAFPPGASFTETVRVVALVGAVL